MKTVKYMNNFYILPFFYSYEQGGYIVYTVSKSIGFLKKKDCLFTNVRDTYKNYFENNI